MLSRFSVLFLLTLLLILSVPGAGGQAATAEPVRIGVLATRGAENCLKSWNQTAAYLSERIEGTSFTIVPLTHALIESSMRNAEIDFILTNSSLYIEFEQAYGINRIATLKELRLGRAYSTYGSVIFCRVDRRDIGQLADFRGKSFMGVSESSLGGWLMAWRELLENGIDPFKDFSEVRYGETHDQVVYAVRDGTVDAGAVRTNTLEAMAAEGTIDLVDFHVFPRLHDPDLQTPISARPGNIRIGRWQNCGTRRTNWPRWSPWP